LVERAPEKREVTGSTPVPTTEISQVRGGDRGSSNLIARFRAPPVPHRNRFKIRGEVAEVGTSNQAGAGQIAVYRIIK